jgi:hypothetical protein
MLIAYSSSKPDQLGHGAARFLGFRLVLGGGADDRDRWSAAGLNTTQPGFGIAGLGDLLGIPGVVRRGVQDTTSE